MKPKCSFIYMEKTQVQNIVFVQCRVVFVSCMANVLTKAIEGIQLLITKCTCACWFVINTPYICSCKNSFSDARITIVRQLEVTNDSVDFVTMAVNHHLKMLKVGHGSLNKQKQQQEQTHAIMNINKKTQTFNFKPTQHKEIKGSHWALVLQPQAQHQYLLDQCKQTKWEWSELD